MSFRWLKPYLPRNLFGRAILILLLPVVTVLLVVSVVFIQRHFEGVTEQMTRSVSREVRLILQEGGDTQTVAETLEIDVVQIPPETLPRRDSRRWYDFTGRFVIRYFEQILPSLVAVDLPDDHVVHLFFERPDGALKLSFDRRRVSASNPHQLLVNMVVFGGLMTVVSYFYLRNQLRPITRLARAAEAFGRGRHVAYRPTGATEVRAAGNAFLDMRARIERQIEQRTLMLSGVSHDMRTPLTRLKLGLSMLEDEERAALEQDVEDMERLLDEFLAFARGAQEGEPEPVDPVALVSQIIEDFQRGQVPVTLALVEGEGQVALRPGGIRRAVENLVGNATRYGTRAEVSVLITDKTLRIRVEDDGPGIPADQREEAVKPFARLDPARNQNTGTGVGLGLSIALDIARAHGGTLRLGESQRLGGLQADIVIGR
ncbi:ATP-binding protein [uncultured Roseovarius sp.]|uniref:ATP-binding protein n=1 Tax=uncultured Roseovarius sp. TaxID=293344 RepID=UPI0025F2EEF8|nr:ATP-binding protein [uncultured Roseovarius sp.]